jgi:hypothetical protein
VLRVDATGNLNWSHNYKVQMGITPSDMLLNPYNPNSVIIVGTVMSNNFDTDGFFMELDGIQGNVLKLKSMGSPVNNESFKAVIPGAAVNPANIAGFILAGSTQNGGNTLPWIIKITPGAGLLWSNIINASSGANEGFVDVLERYNTLSNYEYYGLVKSSAGMVVVKLDDAGLPFPIAGPVLSNEFVYDLAGTAPSEPACLSAINGPPGSPDVGLQVYGTAFNLSGLASSYMVKTYFNGETNCSSTLTVQNPVSAAPVTIMNMVPLVFTGLGACSNFQVVAWFPGGTLNFPCSGYMQSGSNQRLTLTAIDENVQATEGIAVYPNPADDALHVNFTLMNNETVAVELLDVLGKKVLSLPAMSGSDLESPERSIELSLANIPSGIYFVSLNKNGFVSKHKVLVQ